MDAKCYAYDVSMEKDYPNVKDLQRFYSQNNGSFTDHESQKISLKNALNDYRNAVRKL